MRQSMIEVLGHLITYLATGGGPDNEAGDVKQIQKEIGNLFTSILERALDNSSYVRARVFTVLTKLLYIKDYKFPKQRLQITTTAVSCCRGCRGIKQCNEGFGSFWRLSKLFKAPQPSTTHAHV